MSTDSCLIKRPGGFDITGKALKYCSFQQGSEILDIGCGSGATVSYMNEVMNFNAIGVDIEHKCSDGKNKIIKAPAHDLPFPALSFDGLMMECSFSLMSEPEEVLDECHRVLRENGWLIISDMYARDTQANLKRPLGRLDTREIILSRLHRKRFSTELFEDHTHALQTMWGQMIFERGAGSFYNDMGVTGEEFRRIKCGYYLLIARKESSR